MFYIFFIELWQDSQKQLRFNGGRVVVHFTLGLESFIILSLIKHVGLPRLDEMLFVPQNRL